MADGESGDPTIPNEMPPKRRRGRPPNPEREGIPRKDYSGVELLKWANGVLASHGLVRGATEDDVAALRALAEARGWGHATEEHRQRPAGGRRAGDRVGQDAGAAAARDVAAGFGRMSPRVREAPGPL